jgi:hypothetical protein
MSDHYGCRAFPLAELTGGDGVILDLAGTFAET